VGGARLPKLKPGCAGMSRWLRGAAGSAFLRKRVGFIGRGRSEGASA
jgi:hypothetical protein